MIYVLHHADTDGYASKWAAWTLFGDEGVRYYPVNYGWDFPIKEELTFNDIIYILDFSFPVEVLDRLAEKCRLVVIDHHKTALEACRDRPYFHGNINHAGCTLAWNFFHPEEYRVPQLLLHIQDWDLWQFKLENTKAIHTMAEVRKENMTWWTHNKECPDTMMTQALAMNELHEHEVKMLATKAWKDIFASWNAIIVNASYPFISDVADHLLKQNEDCQIAVVFSVNKASTTVGLRSRSDSDIDVGEIAKQNGGGGHKHSAGFNINKGDG